MIAEWITPALLGIDQPQASTLAGPVGELLDRLPADADAAVDFSRRLAVLAACGRAGFALAAAPVALPEAADADPRVMPPTHPLAAVLAEVFDGSAGTAADLRLRHEAATRLAALGLHLPHAVLPGAIAAGARQSLLRPLVSAVLGPRGRWLAARHPDGAAFRGAGDGDAAVDWDLLGHAERLAWFRAARAADAGAARARLAPSLSGLPAKERADFAAAFEIGLGDDDRPLLEPLLKDRSKDVRQTVARLLALLPGSALHQHLVESMTPLLTAKRGLLFGKSWQLDAPSVADPDWAALTIEAARPQHEALGERAWWLYQLVRLLPLSWWTERTDLAPQDLVPWARKTDWGDALLRGWCERVGAGEPEWIAALLELRSGPTRHHAQQLLGLLPVARREAYWPETIEALARNGALAELIAAYAPGETLSPRYSAAIAGSLFACFADDRLRHDYGLRAYLADLASLLAPEALAGLPALPRRGDETPAMAECAVAVERVLGLRRALHRST